MSDKPGAIWLRNNPRLGGTIMILLSALSIYYVEGLILDEAKTGKPMIAIHLGYIVIVTLGSMGAWSLIGGRKAVEYLQSFNNREKTPLFYGVVFLLALPGIIAFFYLKSRLSAMGYN